MFELLTRILVFISSRRKEMIPYSTNDWCVSPFDFMDEVRAEMHLPPKVIIHDSTLRDGEQHPGIVFTKEDKVKIAKALDEYGVHRIEVMPAVSQEDSEAVIEMTTLGLRAEIAGFCRSNINDVAVAIRCGVPLVEIEIFASPYMLHINGWTLEQAAEKIIKATLYAKEHNLKVANFIMDATRTPWEDLRRFLEKIIANGHPDSICIPDSRGVLIPQATYHLIRKLKECVQIPVEIHAHNHFGFGTANALVAVCAGAEVVHTSVNGLGEGAGNTALEEIALDLRMMLGIDMGINYSKTFGLCKLVERLSGISLQSTKALVGDKVFTSESGIAVSRLLRMKEKGIPLVPYSDSIFPEFLGRKREILIGKKSGRASIVYKLQELGMSIPPEEVQEELLEAVKEYSLMNKKAVSDEVFRDILTRILTPGNDL
jgi:isopropylmalate/homocitrate/citramalate synthase